MLLHMDFTWKLRSGPGACQQWALTKPSFQPFDLHFDVKSDCLVICVLTIWIHLWILFYLYCASILWQTTQGGIAWLTVSGILERRRFGTHNPMAAGVCSCCFSYLAQPKRDFASNRSKYKSIPNLSDSLPPTRLHCTEILQPFQTVGVGGEQVLIYIGLW